MTPRQARLQPIGSRPSRQFPVSNEIEASQVAKMIAVPSGDADSLHRLIMDLHKTLNRLAASCAEEVVAGAHAHSLRPDDRPLVEAFMHGVDSTRALKFDHPGLDTTATRSGPRLIIQNDIGETDAHVVVISIENLVATITYTDVHRARAEFFCGLFDQFPMHWSGLDRKSAKALVFTMVAARCASCWITRNGSARCGGTSPLSTR